MRHVNRFFILASAAALVACATEAPAPAPASHELGLVPASATAAKANPGSQLVIMHRDSDEQKDTMAHLIFNVTDMTATVAAITAAGGKMERAPFVFGNTGVTIGLGVDPAGNHFEMLQQPQH